MAKILIACEESQIICKEFRILGHESYSCDIIDCSGGHPEWHIKEDAIKILYSEKWDLVIAHPPCTRLTNSGVCWLEKRNLWIDLKNAISFFNQFTKYGLSGNKILIENPIPHKYAKNGFIYDVDNKTIACEFSKNVEKIKGIGNYSQLIHPWQFGHGESKATCLWLFNLPKLLHTNVVEGREQKLHKLPPTPDRAKLRSKTYLGIAQAIAQQYNNLF